MMDEVGYEHRPRVGQLQDVTVDGGCNACTRRDPVHVIRFRAVTVRVCGRCLQDLVFQAQLLGKRLLVSAKSNGGKSKTRARVMGTEHEDTIARLLLGGLTQARIARMLGVSPGAVNYVVNRPTSEALKRAAQVSAHGARHRVAT